MKVSTFFLALMLKTIRGFSFRRWRWTPSRDVHCLKAVEYEQFKLQNIMIGDLRDGVRGVEAVESIDPGKAVVTVPADYALEVTNNRPPTPFPLFVSQSLWEKSLWYQRLAFKLIFEYKIEPNPDKAAWFKQLPRSFSTPLHWAEEDIDILQYPALQAKIRQQRVEWHAFYATLHQDTKVGKDISYDDFVWAMENAISRTFSGVYEGSNAKERSALMFFTGFLTFVWPIVGLGTYEQSISGGIVVAVSIVVRDLIFSKAGTFKRYVMCPVIDMFNHNSQSISDVSYNYFFNTFELRTQEYRAGDQVFISYGKQSNDRLLQYYGFVEANNPNDMYDFGVNIVELLAKFGDDLQEKMNVPFPAYPAPSDRLQRLILLLRNTQVEDTRISGEKSYAEVGKSVSVASDLTVRCFRNKPVASLVEEQRLKSASTPSPSERFDDITVRSLRIMFCSEEEWMQIFGSKAPDDLSFDMVKSALSSTTEELVKQALRSLIQLELDSKPTTIEEDADLLTTMPKNGGIRNERSYGKGFGAGKVSSLGDDSLTADPSGRFSDSYYSAVLFRMEKKKLLRDALSG